MTEMQNATRAGLPYECRTLRLTPGVVQLFHHDLAIMFDDIGNGGLFYGRMASQQQLVVEYVAPFFRSVETGKAYGRGYAVGRAEALSEATWQLRGMQPLGYWLAYNLQEPGEAQLLKDLDVFGHIEVVTEEYAVLVVTRSLPTEVLFRAYTYRTRHPASEWKPLSCSS